MDVMNNKTENSYLLAAAFGHTCITSTSQEAGLEAGLEAFKKLESEFGKIDRILRVR